jgi:hypothetical protein
MKKWLLVTLVVLASGAAWAAEGKLGADVDLTWASKTLWRGMYTGDNTAAFTPSVNFDLWGSGFRAGMAAWWNGADTNGAEAGLPTEKYVYMLSYANSFNKGDKAQVDYNLTYNYHDYYTQDSDLFDYQDLALTLSLPKITECLVPRYTYAYTWSGRPGPTPGALGTALAGGAGFYHIFGVDYNFKLADQPMTFCADATYNDGTFGADHDWSHITWGLRTAFKVGSGTFIPGIYYQTSMDDSVNKNDEFYTALSYRFSF